MDLLLTNGRVYTMDPAVPFAQAVAIRGNRVVAVGTARRLQEAYGAGSRVVDLGGRAAMPGFIDAHVHFLEYALSLHQVRLEDARSEEDAARRVAERARRQPAGEWVVGRGWNKNLWPGGAFPSRHSLDRLAPGVPIALYSKDGHALWASSAALERAGISGQTPEPSGGRILRDEHGEPSGVLLENAQALVSRAIPPLERRHLPRILGPALARAQRLGLTGIHDFEGPDALWAFQHLEAQAKLGLRVFMGLTRDGLAAAEALGLRTGFGGDRLRVGLVKLFSDGALGSQTAAMLDDYEGRAGYRGVASLSSEELVEALARARRAGLGVAIHAIGDAANRMALDAVEQVDRALPRDGQIVRIEHAQCVHPEDVPRFARLGAIASVQPVHATSDMELADRHWGARAAYAYAWRSLLEAGVHLAFGTDAPVEGLDPLPNLYAAVTRQRPDGSPPGGWHPEQRLSLAEAARAYTLGSAAAAGLAAHQGSVSPGKLADIVVLSQDIFALPVEALLETRVELTIFDGEVVYGE